MHDPQCDHAVSQRKALVPSKATTMDSIDIDGTPFSVLMDRAVKLKSLQMGEDRKFFDSLPAFYQHSIFNQHDDVKSARTLDFNSRLAAAKQMKEEGNAAYGQGRWMDALLRYEKALSVFRHLHSTDPDFKNQGVKDRFIEEVSYQCQNAPEEQALNGLLCVCYNNIAITCCKMKDYTQAIKACDYALTADGNSDKSYYLRAKSRIAPLSSGSAEQEAAFADLKMAIELNPTNGEAKKLLQITKARVKSQRLRDKATFRNWFDRGEIYHAEELIKAKQSQLEAKRAEKNASKEQDLAIGRQLVQYYEERGMEDEKRKVEVSLNAEIERRNRASLTKLDFRNPTDKMINDAKSMGVDLSDPQTVAVLEHLQKTGNVDSETDSTVEDKKEPKKVSYFRIVGFVVLLVLWVLLTNFRFRKVATGRA